LGQKAATKKAMSPEGRTKGKPQGENREQFANDSVNLWPVETSLNLQGRPGRLMSGCRLPANAVM